MLDSKLTQYWEAMADKKGKESCKRAAATPLNKEDSVDRAG